MSVFMSPLRSSHTPSEKSNSKSSGGKGSASKAFQCLHPGCDKKFTRLQNLKSHLDCHTGVRNFPCDECNARFRRKQDLQRHRRTMHSEAKLHRCPNCDKEFARADALKRHMQSKSRIHACPGNLANAGKNGATVSPSSAPGNVNVNASAAAATPSPAAVSAAAMAAFAPSHNHMAVSAAAAANLQSMQSIQNMQNMQNMQNLQTMQRMQNLQNIQNMHVRGIAAPNSMSALVSSSQLPPMTLQSSLAAANLQAQQVSNMTFPTVASHTIPSNVPSSPPASLPSLTDPDSPNATAY
ncbi:hypothetical protein HK102_004057 [Quaeritorhiza haematococci]|nr:hypothetical protein HK102_004057 [Quaeritorhiza haematococci]